MNKNEAKNLNPNILAYIGDGVYEVMIRKYVVSKGTPHIDAIHKETVKYVKGQSQAKALRGIMDILNEEETTVAKRARNKRTLSKPQNIDPVSYKLATAFEALIGYLYTTEQEERMKELVKESIAIIEQA